MELYPPMSQEAIKELNTNNAINNAKNEIRAILLKLFLFIHILPAESAFFETDADSYMAADSIIQFIGGMDQVE